MVRPTPRQLLVLSVFALAAGLSTSLLAASGTAREQARETAASSAYAAYEAQLQVGTTTTDSVYLWSVRWQESEKKTKTALSAAQSHLTRMRALQKAVKAKVAAGTVGAADDNACAYYVAEAEVWVADAGGTP